jgi:L-lactate dehydrogenase complex protein LldG
MLESKTREKVLKKLRHALLHKTPEPASRIDFDTSLEAEDEWPELTFARNFTEAGGPFVFCESTADLHRTLAALASERKWGTVNADTGMQDHVQQALEGRPPAGETPARVVACEALSAATGEVLLTDAAGSAASAASHPGDLVAVASVNRVYPDMKEALRRLADRYGAALPAMITALNGGEASRRNAEGRTGTFYLLLVDEG